MIMLSMKRYSIKKKELIPWIKFIWQFEMSEADIQYKLLPTDCIDIIFNITNNMIYQTASQSFNAPPIHINGLRRKSSYIKQSGNIKVIGISFYSYGLYPFVNTSLSVIQDKIIDVFDFHEPLAAIISSCDDDFEKIENALCSMLKVTNKHIYNTQLIDAFINSNTITSINDFCIHHKINIKFFERMVLCYTGYTPKVLYRIHRFQSATNELVHGNVSTIIDVVYDNGFSDQSHFTKDFKYFTGIAPREFQTQKDTIKQNVSYTYK